MSYNDLMKPTQRILGSDSLEQNLLDLCLQSASVERCPLGERV
nr:hypothetical protein [Corynebacterium tuscaniense]